MPPPPYRRPLQAASLGLAVTLTLGLSGLLSPRPAPRYIVTDLSVLPGYVVNDASAINSRGDVSCDATPAGSSNGGAILYHGGRLTSLNTLPGEWSSDAQGINSRGEVTGKAWLPNTVHHAFLYSGGRTRDLGTLPGFTDSGGVGINDRGQVAGNATSNGRQAGAPREHAFLYNGGRMTGLPLPPGCLESRAVGINAAGQIVGTYRWAARYIGPRGPFLYDSRTKTMTILPMPKPYIRGWAYRANGSGQVIGDAALPDGTCHAALWHGKQMTDLGTLPGYAASIGNDLNSRGEAVGKCFEDGSIKTFLRNHAGANNPMRRYLDRDMEHAFVYRDGKMQDLNEMIPRDAGWILEGARGINDQGQIVGQGLHDGRERAFLLTPR